MFKITDARLKSQAIPDKDLNDIAVDTVFEGKVGGAYDHGVFLRTRSGFLRLTNTALPMSNILHHYTPLNTLIKFSEYRELSAELIIRPYPPIAQQ